MISGRKNVLEWFNETGNVFWVIYYKGKTEGGQYLFRHEDMGDDNATATDARLKLEKALGMLHQGNYTICSMAKAKNTGRGSGRIDFEVPLSDSNHQAASVGAASPGLTPDDVNRMVAEGIEKYKAAQELAELKAKVIFLEKENKELQKEDPWAPVIGMIPMFAKNWIEGQAVAGIPQPANDLPPHKNFIMPNEQTTPDLEITDAEHERLTNVVSVLYNAAPTEWLTLLEKLAAKVQAKPDIIATFKMFL